MMRSAMSLCTLVTALTLASARASGQSTPEKPDARYALESSHSFNGTIARGDVKLGDLNTTAWRLGYLHRVPVSDDWSGMLGFEWQRFDFGTPAAAPLPGSLQEVALKLGAIWYFKPDWTAMIEVDPGLFSDWEDISSHDINAPGTVNVTWKQSPALTWVFGLRYDAFSEIPVIPGAGLRWKVDERWTLSLIMPRPRVEFAWDERVTLFAGAEWKGGGFRVAEDFGRRVGDPRLDGERLSYREIRAGAGLRIKLREGMHAGLEGGWAIDRRFAFDDARLQLNGKGAPYVQLGITGWY